VRAKSLERLVGVVIGIVVALAAALIWFGIAATEETEPEVPQERLLFGVWDIFYDTRAPSIRLFSIAAGLALLFAAGVALLTTSVDSVASLYQRQGDPPRSAHRDGRDSRRLRGRGHRDGAHPGA